MVDVIIPTYKPDKSLFKLIDRLNSQTVKPNKIILMNTEEKYYDSLVMGQKHDASGDNLEVHHLSKREFDHGRTRNFGVMKSKADIFIMMTQDAMPADDKLIEKLIAPLEDESIAAAYARQLASVGSSTVEKLTRIYNYPSKSLVKGKKDIERLQIKAFFCSNVCCAYRRETFDELGGFVNKAIFNEDMLFAAKALNEDFRIAYVAGARVFHSHEYSAKQQFKRNFDNGVSHRDNPEVFENIKSEGEGKRMVKTVINKLCANKEASKVPGYIWMSACKYMGFKLGERYDKLPKKLVVKCTTNPDYFKK